MFIILHKWPEIPQINMYHRGIGECFLNLILENLHRKHAVNLHLIEGRVLVLSGRKATQEVWENRSADNFHLCLYYELFLGFLFLQA